MLMNVTGCSVSGAMKLYRPAPGTPLSVSTVLPAATPLRSRFSVSPGGTLGGPSLKTGGWPSTT